MKKLFAILLSVMLVLSLAACSITGNDSESTPAAGGEMKSFTVTVVHKDGSSKDFTYESDKEFVGPVLQEAGLIKGNDGPYGLEITEVDGEKAVYATDKAYWAVYEGETYALQGIDTTPIRDGGVYKLVYTGA